MGVEDFCPWLASVAGPIGWNLQFGVVGMKSIPSKLSLVFSSRASLPGSPLVSATTKMSSWVSTVVESPFDPLPSPTIHSIASWF